jgi:hypothetical protein
MEPEFNRGIGLQARIYLDSVFFQADKVLASLRPFDMVFTRMFSSAI